MRFSPDRFFFPNSYESGLINVTFLGLIAVLVSKWIIAIYFLALILYILAKKSNRSSDNLLLFLSVLVPFELIARVLSLHPVIPTEVGKYIFLVLGLWVLVSPEFKRYKFILYFFLVLSVFGFLHGEFSFYYWRYVVLFNYSGLFGIFSLFVIALSKMFSSDGLKRALVGIFSQGWLLVLVLFLFFNERYSNFEFRLAANNIFSGDYGSNQVATILGFTAVIPFLSYFTRLNLKVSLIVVVVSVIQFSWSLMTFSRGGIITAFSSLILVYILWLRRVGFNAKRFATVALISTSMLVFLVFINDFTDNNLLLRYQGHSNGTIQGHKLLTMNQFTNGRFDIMLSDLSMFSENIWFGTGIGLSPLERLSHGFTVEVAPHIEFSRLLAEQGLLGLVLLILSIVIVWKTYSFSDEKYLFIGLTIISILSLSHSATRTSLPVICLFMAMSTSQIIRTDK